ncbi:sialoadhesin [Xyrichtys novacula]|nr:sialoadhesin [Xyrichtys novacula]
MRIFLGAVFAIRVTGDDKNVNVEGCKGKEVLLPCNCSGRSLSEEFLWMMGSEEEEQEEMLFKYNSSGTFYGQSSKGEEYKGRIQFFFPTESSNCSLLLTNIETEDLGTYTCRFTTTVYKKNNVKLQMRECPEKIRSRSSVIPPIVVVSGVFLLLYLLYQCFRSSRRPN